MQIKEKKKIDIREVIIAIILFCIILFIVIKTVLKPKFEFTINKIDTFSYPVTVYGDADIYHISIKENLLYLDGYAILEMGGGTNKTIKLIFKGKNNIYEVTTKPCYLQLDLNDFSKKLNNDTVSWNNRGFYAEFCTSEFADDLYDLFIYICDNEASYITQYIYKFQMINNKFDLYHLERCENFENISFSHMSIQVWNDFSLHNIYEEHYFVNGHVILPDNKNITKVFLEIKDRAGNIYTYPTIETFLEEGVYFYNWIPYKKIPKEDIYLSLIIQDDIKNCYSSGDLIKYYYENNIYKRE